jgi:peptide-methionine (S)-S-oxide reductase
MTDNRLEVATLGGGCFWCLEAVFQEVPGVERIVSGYAGGQAADPTYRAVCSGTTGHAEVVQVHFDPERLPYRRLLEIFFAIHDPTTLNRQGADTGTQYRSVILTHSPEQAATAEELVRELTVEKLFDAPIVTEIEPLAAFYSAEDYHQNYYRDNPYQPYCRAVISPKLAKYRAKFLAPAER